jgi:crossover junction endodeoxyribonuclease RusA
MRQPIEIRLSWPTKCLQSNARCHWKAKGQRDEDSPTRSMGGCTGAKATLLPEASILIEYWPRHRRYDVANVPSSLKASIDGIADAMGCDDRCFRVDYPTMFAGTSKDGAVVFRVYER